MLLKFGIETYFTQYQKIFTQKKYLTLYIWFNTRVIPNKIRNRIDMYSKSFVGNVALIIWLTRHDNKIEKHKLLKGRNKIVCKRLHMVDYISRKSQGVN